MLNPLKLAFPFLLGSLFLLGCSSAKLEARLEADPQCKPIINPKTGSLMPCPGTEKSFYAALALTPARVESTPNVSSIPQAVISPPQKSSAIATTTPPKISPLPDCKPQIHKKTGSSLPCPVD
jgi:hypothetical protein